MRVGIETTNQKYMFIEDGACKRYFPIKDNKLDGDAFVQSLNSHLEKLNCQFERLKADNWRVREVNKLLSEALTKNNLKVKDKDEKIVNFINELAWQDVKYDAFQSTVGEFPGSPSAIPKYAKKYFDLWNEMFEEDLEQIEKEKK